VNITNDFLATATKRIPLDYKGNNAMNTISHSPPISQSMNTFFYVSHVFGALDSQ